MQINRKYFLNLMSGFLKSSATRTKRCGMSLRLIAKGTFSFLILNQ